MLTAAVDDAADADNTDGSLLAATTAAAAAETLGSMFVMRIKWFSAS